MTLEDFEEHVLTLHQQTVVDQPWDARVLVTAGAGAGKTYTLVRRLDVLVEREELEAAEILVLTFSRAAVRDLRERIDRHATAARRVRAQTFDSWATSLLKQAYPDTDWTGVSFDDRIVAASEAIDRGVLEAGEQGAPGHVVIDEVQDLVGVRREMVQALLDRFADNCGFTVVGDAAQSIYGFQVSDPEQRAAETNYFFDWLRGTFSEDLTELHLSDNFRARTVQSRVALPLGPRLQQLPRDPDRAAEAAERIHAELRASLLEAPEFGKFTDEFTLDSLRWFPGTTAVLCRDNGQVLHVSGLLADGGVAHRLQRSTRDRPAPSWMAALLTGTEASQITYERFAGLLDTNKNDELVLPEGATLDELWQSARRVARGPRATLDMRALYRALAEGRLPDEITAPEPSPLVISSVHRAKGLEFDRVLVIEPRTLMAPRQVPKKKYDYDPAAEARLLYVAMTRPRDDLYRLEAPSTWLYRKDRRLDRWYLGGRSKWARNGLEALGTDVCHEAPHGARGMHHDAVEVQKYLRTSIRAGEAVELRLLHQLPAGEEQSPPYAMLHEERQVGQVSEQFRRDLCRLLRRGGAALDRPWPALITGLRVDGVESVAGSAAATERAGLGDHGVWLAVRLCGMGRFDWNTDAATDVIDHGFPEESDL
ncbi:UvrD-helicase domain-containing protein [Actinacidiphila soli]|uniref:UvrD-helicase domain-containing protein n=1 Tax=Actinacidiphila soli TaxID=2487275 RepID=UPI000FC9B9AB|nr:UvrD-helicase domain-containing protein [Actinacidiphila soli]